MFFQLEVLWSRGLCSEIEFSLKPRDEAKIVAPETQAIVWHRGNKAWDFLSPPPPLSFGVLPMWHSARKLQVEVIGFWLQKKAWSAVLHVLRFILINFFFLVHLTNDRIKLSCYVTSRIDKCRLCMFRWFNICEYRQWGLYLLYPRTEYCVSLIKNILVRYMPVSDKLYFQYQYDVQDTGFKIEVSWSFQSAIFFEPTSISLIKCSSPISTNDTVTLQVHKCNFPFHCLHIIIDSKAAGKWEQTLFKFGDIFWYFFLDSASQQFQSGYT